MLFFNVLFGSIPLNTFLNPVERGAQSKAQTTIMTECFHFSQSGVIPDSTCLISWPPVN